MSDCRITHGHCGPGVSWRTDQVSPTEKIPECFTELSNLMRTTTETSNPCDHLDEQITNLGAQHPQHYITGYLRPYSKNGWESWMKRFEAQNSLQFKVSTGLNKNKESDTGVIDINGKLHIYKITWRQMYNCSRGNKPRYKKSPSECSKPRNAPGSRLMNCKATLNARLLRLESGEEIMQLTIPISSAHTNHDIDSLADLLTHKPLPEIEEKVESLIRHSHLSQISLILALKDWIKHELIPQHLRSGILSQVPNEHDCRYFPTAEDVKNMSKRSINKMRKNMFDQDALESFLKGERDDLTYYIRKYQPDSTPNTPYICTNAK